MLYNDYLKKVAERLNARLRGIDVEFNFDHGPEFEVALCKTFRDLLPDRFGVCRGFIVDKKGEKAGDDIVIYDRHHFPTFRMHENADYALKEQIPIEAAYAYVEAKHGLTVHGKGATLGKAITQATKVKQLVSSRKQVSFEPVGGPYGPYGSAAQLGNIPAYKIKLEFPLRWPPYRNPFFTAVLGRTVRRATNSRGDLKGEDVSDLLSDQDTADLDLLVAGPDVVGLPVVYYPEMGEEVYYSPFRDPKGKLMTAFAPGLAFAAGICSMLYALESIQLGSMDWPGIMADAIGWQRPGLA